MSQQVIQAEGAAIYAFEDTPFTKAEWAQIATHFDEKNTAYESIGMGDTDETLKLHVLRVKQRQKPYNDTALERLFTSEKVTDFLRKATGMQRPFIDRLQGHIYNEGGFIAYHVDQKSCPEYLYTLVLMLNHDYDGGEFVVQHPRKGGVPFKAPKHSLTVTSCAFGHEVKMVTRGTRHTVCIFLKEADPSKQCVA